MESSKGVSIRDTRISRYSLTPLNSKRVRPGRVMRVGGGKRRPSWSGREKGVSNPMLTYLRLAITAKPATIASGEMYPERGVLERVMWTRSVVDKRIFGSAGNGMASNSRSCSYTGTGADVEALKQGGRQTRHRGWGRPHGAGAGALTQHVWTLTQHAGPGM
jgi:hypothetical protein